MLDLKIYLLIYYLFLLSIDKSISTICLQVDGSQDPAAMAGVAPALEQREEVYDPLATPDVDK